MADAARMVFLGFGKYVRADRIYALEPLGAGDRGGGRRTRVWVEGIPEPIVAVDMFGYPCELDELRALCDRHGLALIADSCEALGAEYKGAPVGSHAVSAAFGFYPNKQITTGEGGMVTTHSEEEWQLLRSLRNQGRSYEARWFHHVRLAVSSATGHIPSPNP